MDLRELELTELSDLLSVPVATLKKQARRMNIEPTPNGQITPTDAISLVATYTQPRGGRPEETTKAAKNIILNIQNIVGAPAAPSPVPEPAPLPPAPAPLPVPPASQDGQVQPPAPTTSWDPGYTVFGMPAANFFKVAILVLVQAWFFSQLATVALQGHTHPLMMYLAGVLFESAGIAAAMGFTGTTWRGGSKVHRASIYLWSFFTVQVLVDFTVLGLFAPYTDVVARILIGISIPMALLVYGHLYMK